MPEIVLDEEALAALRRLADVNGVATDFWDWSGQHHWTSPRTLLQVLATLGVPVTPFSGPGEIQRALTWTEDRPWTFTLPQTTVLGEGVAREIPVHVPHGDSVHVWVQLEDGSSRGLEQLDRYVDPRQVGDNLIGRATFLIPADLPLGYHRLCAEVGGTQRHEAFLYVVPGSLRPSVLGGSRRFWGVNVQAYSVRSHSSWGLGDAGDLLDLTALCAAEGSDFILINPLHAAEPIAPVEDSPYLPISRRWLNLLYIRPEMVFEYRDLGPRARSRIEALRQTSLAAEPNRGGGLNRDAMWEAKRQALQIVFERPRPVYRQAQFEAFIERGGTDLANYALWCALVEHFGTVDLPAEVETLGGAEVERLRQDLASQVEFYQWAQWVASSQLHASNHLAQELGMPIGIMSDLAVGIAPAGPEIWGNQGDFALDMSVGAPPDMYSQNGQDWSQPPWNPRALERSGFRALREVLTSAMDLAGALRIDHILGLFRQWWIPRGESSSAGTYVYFNHEAMVGILLLEAHRRDTLVIGEDLGTVEPWVRHYLGERGILGTSVLWFEKDFEGRPLPANEYREGVLATVNTHDLPPTAGYLEGIHTDLRAEAGMLVESLEATLSSDEGERQSMFTRLREWGLIGADPSETEVIEALHRYIARTPSRLVAAALVDAVGQRLPQNLPGTHTEYPNWKVPLCDADANPIWLEDLASRADFQAFFETMRTEMGSNRRLGQLRFQN